MKKSMPKNFSRLRREQWGRYCVYAGCKSLFRGGCSTGKIIRDGRRVAGMLPASVELSSFWKSIQKIL
ncbi:hypothetical protein FMM72_15300 [Anaerotruncus colihominis]|uniref:Uncharacterized protein n=1 Tax=Anaerotruncus colihominis TaxID=169435 RepID=A0A845T1E5_9FIRM|nr:hypothetical protein [Anaerotruncus colihominis]